ncbi:aldehyde dehydrogenase family protein [Litchfieldella qijiaojingensis]|uniref:aldehyde dehydrogenase family protein n=1 Tax=Litchfieldella qijiaojingensis TaxID=980347 RepID=UPI0027E3D324|nr:aldehyde dehydrogenase family protein [Halomonas qijiaojingensis]
MTDAVIFTGTPENARKVRKNFKKGALFILNGAGHNPLVVSHDADVSLAVQSALRVVLYNQGQDCAGPNSLLVHGDVYEEFKLRLIESIEKLSDKVGDYTDPDVIVGPNSDKDHAAWIANIFKENRKYFAFGGNVNPVTGMIYPTVFEKPLSLGGNYKEFFAPVFYLQRYDRDVELRDYFINPRYYPNAMYISLFGTSDAVDGLDESMHKRKSILRNTDLHLEERGFLPYGGEGPAASCLYVDGKQIKGSTLPQRDIYEQLVRPFI